MGNADLVRTSRDGDQFHYLWASRKALLLLSPVSGLDTLTIEGPSKSEFIEVVEDGEEIVDVGEYYNSNNFSDASKIIYTQLKHSTLHAHTPFDPSKLRNTIEGFSKRYRRLLQIESKVEVLKKVEFHFVSNRPINEGFYKSINELKESGYVTTQTNLKKLEEYTSLTGTELLDFIRLVKFPSQEPNYLAQREILIQEVYGYLPGDDTHAPNELKELITRKALSENQDSPEIRKIDVLRALRTNPDDLFPVKNLIKKLDQIVDRPQARTLIDSVTSSSSQKFIIQAEGGVGKSILSAQIYKYIPENSFSIVYDCFGNGDYRQSSSARHSHKVALVQIANELAGLGLCHPLIPTTSASNNDYIKAFLFRLKQVSEKISFDEEAQLFIVIDAADNSQMAANEFNYCRSFITDLLQETLPHNIKLIALSRPYRVSLLIPKQDVELLNLESFTEDETKQHLLNYYPNVSSQDVFEFHRLTSSNPRVQSIALGQKLSLLELLSFFGNTPKNVEDTIKDLLDKAITTAKEHNFIESDKIDILLTSIAILRPLIPLNILSNLTNIREDQIRSIISDIGGHPIRLSDNYIQFVDEPTESWFREVYKPNEMGLLSEFAEKLKPLAVNSAYAASVLPQVLMDAGKFEELVELSLNSEMLPNTSILEKRKVELQRLQFAIKAGIKLSRYTEVAKLSLKAGGEVAAETRQNQLLEDNIDLVGATFDDNQILELVSEKVFKGGSWQGSQYIIEAKLLSYRPQFHGESRSKLRIADQWLRSWFKLPKDQRKNENVEFKELSDYFITLLSLEGTDHTIHWLRGFRPKTVSYHIGELATKELIRHKKNDLIETILDESGNNIFLVLGIVESLAQNHCEISSNILSRTLNLLCDRRVQLNIGIKPILYFLETTVKQGLCSEQKAHNILTRYMPKEIPYEIRASYGYSERSTHMKAYALYKAWSGSPLELIDLVPENLKEEFLKETTYSSSEEITTIKRDVAALVPWYKLYAQSIAGLIASTDLNQFITQAKEVSKKAQGYSYRENGYHLENEIANIWFDILVLNKNLTIETYTQIDDYFKDKIYPKTRNYFTSILALNPQNGLDDCCYFNNECNLKQLEKSEEHAETLINDYILIAQAIFPLSKDEANEVLKLAIEVSNKLGEENLQRWDALLCYAEKAGQEKASRPNLAYRFSQCAELTYRYVHRDKHFPWDYTVDAIYDLDPNSAFAIASRWRDRRFGEDDRILNNLTAKLLNENFISALIPLSFLTMGASYHLDKIISHIKEMQLNTFLKQVVIQRIYQYVIVPNPTDKNINLFKDLYNSLLVKNKEIEFFLNSVNNSKIHIKSDDKLSSSSYEEKDFNWDVFFKACTNSSQSIDFELAFENFQNLERKYWFRDSFYSELFQRVNSNQATEILNFWFNDPRNGIFDLRNFIGKIPDNFFRRLSFKRLLGKRLKVFLKSNYLDVHLNRYGSNIKLDLLSKITDISETEYIQCLLEGVSESSIALGSENLFRLSNLLIHLIKPSQSTHILEYGLALLESDLGVNVADGVWRNELAPPSSTIESIAGYIWSGLASPFKTIRWQATHTVKLICDLQQQEIISSLINFIKNDTYRSFYDHKFEFYKYAAIQWLLIALLRVSYAENNFLFKYTDTFKQLAESDRPHLMIRLLASKIILNLSSLNLIDLSVEDIQKYKTLGKSSFNKVQRKAVDLSRYSNLKDDDIEKFGIDFGPYWLDRLGKMFGLHTEHIYFETTETLRNEIGFKEEKRRSNDMRHELKVYEWKQTNHDHGSSPKVEDLDFYLSYHAMMITADKLLQTRPLVESEYSWPDFEDWVKRYDLSSLEPYWLSDFRDPVPKMTTEWSKEDRDTPFNWTYSCSIADYDDSLYVDDEEFCLWGVWSEVNSKAKDIRIRSSLVSTETSNALWRSLQAAESSHDYHLPSVDDERLELDEDNFKLKGWIAESDFDLSDFDDDLWSAALRYHGIKPSDEIIALMNLNSDLLEKNWFCSEEKVISLNLWGEYQSEHEEYSNGYKLNVNKKFVLDLLNKINMDMIISVDINRRHKYGSYDYKQDKKGLDEYLPSSKRVYLMKKNGEMYVY